MAEVYKLNGMFYAEVYTKGVKKSSSVHKLSKYIFP